MSAAELPSVTKVKWTSMGVDDVDCARIGNLASCGALDTIVKLDLSYNAFSGKGMEDFMSGLSRDSMRSLKCAVLNRTSPGCKCVRRMAAS